MIAYFILVHRYPEQFKRLFKAIYDPDHFYVVHVDKRSGVQMLQNIKTFLSDYPHTKVLKSKNALWGGYSLVDAQLRGIKALLKMSPSWKHFINLSGQDFPLKSQDQIKTFLKKHTGEDFLKVGDQRKTRPLTNSRFENYCIEYEDTVVQTKITRAFLPGVTPYIGNQWMILTRKFCEFLFENAEVNRFKKFYQNTFIADESFFQTVIMNTSYKPTIVNDDMRAIDRVPDGTIKLRPRTFTIKDTEYLFGSHHLFARKFDETVDGNVLDVLEAYIPKPAYRTYRRHNEGCKHTRDS